MWMFTAACPSNCSYCDIQSQKRHRGLDTADVERVAHELVTLGFREVMFAGGEPFLSPDLPAALRILDGRIPTTVFTGGLPGLSDDAVEIAREGGVRRLVYSIDAGAPARNDLLRGRKGITAELIAFARAVRDRLPRIDRSVNTVVSRHNVDHLDEIWDTMSPFGLNSWSLTLAGDFFEGSPSHALLDRTMLEAFYLRTVPRLAERLLRDRAELVVLPVPFPFLAARTKPSQWGVPLAAPVRAELDHELELYSRGEYNATFVERCGCPLVGTDVVIGVAGDLHPCSQPPIIQPQFVLGNVRHETIGDLLRGEALQRFAAGVPQSPCTRCWAPSNIPREVLIPLLRRAAPATAALAAPRE